MNETFKLVYEIIALSLATISGFLAMVACIIIMFEIRRIRKEETKENEGW